MATEPCECDQAKALRSELSDLRAAAYGVLAWIDRSTSVGYGAAQRLERALAVGAREAEPEVVAGVDGRERMRRFALCRHDILMHECESCRPIHLGEP